MKKTVWKIVLAVVAVAIAVGVGIWMKNRGGGQPKKTTEAPVTTQAPTEKPPTSALEETKKETEPASTAAPTEPTTVDPFDGRITVNVKDTEEKLLASKEIGFKAGQTIADLLPDNFKNVTIDNGMLMTIESLTTPADWSSYIAFYINGEYAMEGVMTQPFIDADVIDFVDTVYIP